MSSRTNARNAFETGLNGGIGDSDSTITLDSTVGLVAPGILVIDPDSLTLREVITYVGLSGSDLTGCVRGEAGSAAGAQAHGNAIRIRSVFAHQYLDLIFDDIEALEAVDTAHAAAGDPHTVYQLESLHTKAQHDALVLDHAALANLAVGDPHTQYFEAADHTKATHDSLLIDADTVDGVHAAGFTLIAHDGAGGTAHADAVAGGADGFITGADQTKLDDLPAGTGFGTTPLTVTPQLVASIGSSTLLARSDHRHGSNAVTPANIGTANSEGSGSDFVRGTHVHRIQDARAVAIAGGHGYNGSPSGLGASFASKLNVNVARPSGWASTLVIVHATINWASLGGGTSVAQLNGRIRIDSSTSQTFQSSQTEVGDTGREVTPMFSAVTGDSTINIDVDAHYSTNAGGTGKHVALTYILIRAS